MSRTARKRRSGVECGVERDCSGSGNEGSYQSCNTGAGGSILRGQLLQQHITAQDRTLNLYLDFVIPRREGVQTSEHQCKAMQY